MLDTQYLAEKRSNRSTNMGSGASVTTDSGIDDDILSIYADVISKHDVSWGIYYALDESSVLDFLSNTCHITNTTHLRQLYSSYFKHKFSQPCVHTYVEKWGDVYHCCDCRESVTGPSERIVLENEMENQVMNEDIMSYTEDKDISVMRGVSIGWVIEWTNMNDLWDLPTWQVRREYILPATMKTRCRYVDLPHMKKLKRGFNSNGDVNDMSHVVGHASTFCSHCWGGKWGDLVAAISDGADPAR